MPVAVSGPGETVVVQLQGDIDLAMQAPLLCAFDVARGRTSDSVIIDCSGVEFVDSCAIGQVANAVRRVEGDGHHLQLVHVPECMERLIRIMNLWEQFDGRIAGVDVEAHANNQEQLVSFG